VTDAPAPAAPPSAASELFGTDLPAPATLSGFINPGSGTYKDETGSLRYHRSLDQAEQDHREWMNQFDYAARRTAFEKGDMSPYTPEKRAERDAAYRAAAKADNIDLPETVSPATVAHADRHMLPVSVSANEYRLDVSKVSTPESSARTRSEMGEMLAELGYLPGVGSGLMDRIMDLRAETKDMTPEARAVWAANKRTDMVKRAGGEEAFNQKLRAIKDDLMLVKGLAAIWQPSLRTASTSMIGMYSARCFATRRRRKASFAQRRSDADGRDGTPINSIRGMGLR
jgi:hypothetical protein